MISISVCCGSISSFADSILARMCGVASENLVLLQILIGQGSLPTASKTTLYVGALALRGATVLDHAVGHKLYFPMSACSQGLSSTLSLSLPSIVYSAHNFFQVLLNVMCLSMLCPTPLVGGHKWGFELGKILI